MSKRQSIYAHKKIIALFQRRSLVVALLVVTLTVGLLARMFQLQVIEHDKYTTLSKNNQVMILPIAPHRGEIYDRNGVLIAENIPVYNLQILPAAVKDLSTMIKKLTQIIDITPEEIKRFEKAKRQHRRYDKVTLKAKLTEAEVARFYVNQYFYPGVSIETQLMRHYPLKDIMVDVLGYVGRINDRDLARIDRGEYAGTNYIGKIGIEGYFEKTLHGKVGNQQVEVDASGRIIRVMKSVAPLQGNDLYLTVDVRLQQAAKQALKDEYGAVVAIDPQNGEILALASQPAYDPNLFVNGISYADFSILQNDPGRPLYNRAIRGQYPPASAIKPFMAMAGLESGFADPRKQIHDPGYYKLNFSNHVYRCWRKTGHGKVDLNRALVVSCDTYFYDLAFRMGIERVGEYLQKFGFGQPTGVELGEELPGLMPSPSWKKTARKQPWFPGDTVVSGIGQGYMLTTPLQLAHATATMANHGVRMAPHLLLKQHLPNDSVFLNPIHQQPGFESSEENWAYVHRAMQRVHSQGTAKRYGAVPYTIAGKTGTAQVANLLRLQARYGKNIPKELRDNTLFVAFAPVEDPKIAVAAVVENSRNALNVVRAVINAYLLEQNDVQPRDSVKAKD